MNAMPETIASQTGQPKTVANWKNRLSSSTSFCFLGFIGGVALTLYLLNQGKRRNPKII